MLQCPWNLVLKFTTENKVLFASYKELIFLLTDDDETSKFSLKVYHNGEFSNNPCRAYVGGKYIYIDYVDIDNFGMDVLEEMVKQLGYSVDMVFYIHYKIPHVCLDLDLKSLSSDNDFFKLV
ncbi:hypothetical protein Hanom_Chr12g01152211 [Helianthus anomalus]